MTPDWDLIAEGRAEDLDVRRALRALDNREYVRDLLAEKQPAFAVIVEAAVASVTRNGAGTATSPASRASGRR